MKKWVKVIKKTWYCDILNNHDWKHFSHGFKCLSCGKEMRFPEHSYNIDTASEEFLRQQMDCSIKRENYEIAGQLKDAIERRFNTSQSAV